MALKFDGSTQYIDCGNGASLNITSDVSVSAWLMVEENWDPSAQAQNFHSIATKGSSYALGFGLQVYERITDLKTHPRFFIRNPSTLADSGYDYYVDNTWGKNNWVHLVGTFSSSAGRLRLYEAGIQKVEVSTTATPGSTTDPFHIARAGGNYSVNDVFFKGFINDVRVYNRELTPEEIAEIYYKRGADKIWQGLVGRWRMDEKTTGQTASGTGSVIDLSGKGNHGTPYNSPVYQGKPYRLRRGVLVS